MKKPTKKQLLHAAWLAKDGIWAILPDVEPNPLLRGVRLWYIYASGAYLAEDLRGANASMLMSEAHRPAGHDGDGSDEL